ncbi:hypothetical protein [Methylobacterium crusticola]|nr:hypothetical protein [Methylobacterium crusticola]
MPSGTAVRACVAAGGLVLTLSGTATPPVLAAGIPRAGRRRA